jgi:hypothetical protein
MASSTVLTSLAFLSTEARLAVGPISGTLDVWLGSLSALIFFVSVGELVVDWRGSAWRHSHAVETLSALKGDFRGVTFGEDVVDAGGIDLRTEYERGMAGIIEIPERDFLWVKAKHHRKVAVSKRIDEHPGAPLILVRALVMLEGIHRGSEGPKDSSDEGAI